MPNGNIMTTSKYGDVPLNESLVLRDVLYVPSFKFNLLSVGKVLQNRIVECCFYVEFCKKTSKVIFCGNVDG